MVNMKFINIFGYWSLQIDRIDKKFNISFGESIFRKLKLGLANLQLFADSVKTFDYVFVATVFTKINI